MKSVRSPPEAMDGPARSQVMKSISSSVIGSWNEAVSSGTSMLIHMSDSNGNIIAMSQVPNNLPPTPISAEIPRENQDKCTTAHQNLQTFIKYNESERNLSGLESKQDFGKEGSHST